MNFYTFKSYWWLASIVHVLLFCFMLLGFIFTNPWHYYLLIGSQTIAVLGATIAAFWLTPKQLRVIRDWVQTHTLSIVGAMLFCSVGLGFILWYPPVYGIFALTTVLTFGLVLWSCFPDRPLISSRPFFLIIALGVGVAIGIRIYALSVFPPIHRTDEGWALSWSVNYAQTGQIDDLLMRVNLPSSELRHANMQLLQFIALPGLWLRVVGSGYWEMRLFNLLLLIPITGLIVGIAYNWYGRGAALCTAAAMLGSNALMRLANTRPDTGVTLALVLALYLISEADKRKRLTLHLLAGIAAGLGVFSHLNAIGFGVVLTIAIYLPRYLKGLLQGKWLPPKSAVYFVLGGVLVGAAVLLVFIGPNLSGFIEQTINVRTSDNIPQGFFYSLAMNLVNLYVYSNVEVVLLIVGVIALVLRRQANDWMLLLLVLGLHLSLSIIAPTAYDQYIRPLTPIYALITGTLISQALSRQPLRSLNWAQAVTGICLTLVMMISGLRPALAYILDGGTLRLQPTPAVLWIQSHIEPDARLLAPTEYYLWLPEYSNMRSSYLEALHIRNLRLNTAGEEIWDAVNADYIVYDSTQREDMLPASLFEEGYLPAHGYLPIALVHQDQGVAIIYARQNP